MNNIKSYNKVPMRIFGEVDIDKTALSKTKPNLKTIKDFKRMIEMNENFTYVKQGDGEIFCMQGKEGQNCDGHLYSRELGDALISAYTFLNTLPNSYITSWIGENCPVESKANVDGNIFLHNDITVEKYDFFQTLKYSNRKKIYIGPDRLRGVINFLNIDEYIEVPVCNSFYYNFNIIPEDNAIYLFSSGMPSKVWIAKLLMDNRNITCIDIGSGLDPIFFGISRTRQLPSKVLTEFYKLLLNNEPEESTSIYRIPKTIFTIWLSDNPVLPPMVDLCIKSQKIKGYEHKLITLDNCYRNKYIQDAIDAKQWGKASDYLRCWYLIQEGGIHLDADVYVLLDKNFDHLLNCSLFVGTEYNGFANTAVLGAEKGSYLLVDHLIEVEENFTGNDGKYFESSLELITDRLYNAGYIDNTVQIMWPEIFFPYNHQKNTINIRSDTITMHFFMKTWVGL